jgi:hypothetical protein
MAWKPMSLGALLLKMKSILLSIVLDVAEPGLGQDDD